MDRDFVAAHLCGDHYNEDEGLEPLLDELDKDDRFMNILRRQTFRDPESDVIDIHEPALCDAPSTLSNPKRRSKRCDRPAAWALVSTMTEFLCDLHLRTTKAERKKQRRLHADLETARAILRWGVLPQWRRAERRRRGPPGKVSGGGRGENRGKGQNPGKGGCWGTSRP